MSLPYTPPPRRRSRARNGTIIAAVITAVAGLIGSVIATGRFPIMSTDAVPSPSASNIIAGAPASSQGSSPGTVGGATTGPQPANPNTGSGGSATKQSSNPVGQPPVATPPPVQSPPCNKIKITSPSDDGHPVDGPTGVLLTGTACGLAAGETGWIFDYDPYDQYYFGTDPRPIKGNGDWSYYDGPIGDEGDNNKFYTLQVVRASAGCDAFLASYPKDTDDNVKLRRSDFIAGCTFEDSVNISVSWP